MSKLWPSFEKENPCPACGHWDWTCRAGDKKYICMRVQSDHVAADGGFYHDYADTPRPYVPVNHAPVKSIVNFDYINKQFQSACVGDVLNHIAIRLGVYAKSLIQIGIGFSKEHEAYSFPMFDGDGKVIGIRLRNNEGEKWAVKGSKGGLFIPDCDTQPIAFLCEGPTDAAALLTMGFYSIGKPSCNTGVEQIKVALKRLGIHRVVIVSDNDSIKEFGNRPGVEGAKRLKKELGLMSVIWIPTGRVKDVREFLGFVGIESGYRMIQNDLSQKVWTHV